MNKFILTTLCLFSIINFSQAQDTTQILRRSENKAILFGKGKEVKHGKFVGKVYYEVIATEGSQVSNVTFEPGARTNWHMHPDGQILLITEGVGYYQEKGKPIQIIRKGDIVKIAPKVWHWHGASAHKAMSHIALSVHQDEHPSQWGEPVTDKEYNGKIAK